MPSRRRRPRPVPLPDPPAHLIGVQCVLCGLWGGWDPERGLVVHAYAPACRVQWIESAEERRVAA